jgi:hypothetical protein
LPIAYGADGWLYAKDVRTKFTHLHEVVVFDASGYLFEGTMSKFKLREDAIAVAFDGYWTLAGARGQEVWPPELSPAEGPERTVRDRVIALLAEGWGVSFEDVLYASDMSDAEQEFVREIGSVGGQAITQSGLSVVRNPKMPT